VRLHQTFYAAVTRSGELLQGNESQTNGLYTSTGRAQGVLTKKLNLAQRNLKYYSDLRVQRELQPRELQFMTRVENELDELTNTHIREVKVVYA
jgi:hypothetical protein